MDSSKRIFTVPNVLTFFRIIAVPVMMYFVIASGLGQPEWFLYLGLGINILAALTDLVDGWIARRFHQVSDLGKLIDPFADKFMTIGMFVALVVIGNVHWAFLLLIGLKELVMVVAGALILPKRKIIIPSNMYGKVAMWFVTIGILLSFFHKYLRYLFFLDWIVLGIGTILTYAALVSYALILKKKLSEPANGANSESNSGLSDGANSESNSEPADGANSESNSEPANGANSESNSEPADGSNSEPNSEPADGANSEPNSELSDGANSESNSEPAEEPEINSTAGSDGER